MQRLSDLQDRFAAALRDPAAPIPEDLLGRADEFPVARFGVYRNNVHSSLVDALTAAYPTVERLVGTEFFRAMAQQYVRTTLPETPVLIHYGATFASFVAGFEPVRGLPYLADVTRIDWAWHQAYHAPEADPLTAEQIEAIPAGGMGPTVRRVASVGAGPRVAVAGALDLAHQPARRDRQTHRSRRRWRGGIDLPARA
jgi:hypothetical protein